jgi:hypothetical protein
MKAHGNAAFSFIELLVVAAIVALVGAALAAMLAGGLRVWERVHDVLASQSSTAFGMEVLERDLHNGFPFYGVDFQGEADRFSMVGPVVTPGENGAARQVIGVVDYVFDRQRHALVRSARVFPDPPVPDAGTEIILSGIESVTCTYLKQTPDDSTIRWQSAWHEKGAIPKAVCLEWRLRAGDGHTVGLRRTIIVPGA